MIANMILHAWVDGDPGASLELLDDQANLRVIMKDGKVYKNTLP